MGEISKIRVNESEYDIVPQLGTGLAAIDGVVGISLGDGITFDDEGKVRISLGTGLSCDNVNEKIFVNLGTAQVVGEENLDCGLAISEKGFIIDPVKFKEFLQKLNYQFAPLL